MALDPINTGTLPNDNTGDPLNVAWTKANAMFLELYTGLALKGDAAGIAADIAALLVADADFATALALKADASALDAKAGLDVVAVHNVAQALTILQRMQHAKNTGCLVCLNFELLNPTIELDGEWEFELPRLPQDFIVNDATLAITLAGHLDPPDLEFLAELNHSALPVLAQANNVQVPTNGLCPMDVVVAERRFTKGKSIKLTFKATAVTGSAAGVSHGLALWLRGIWADGAGA